jgi:hypothetical protein
MCTMTTRRFFHSFPRRACGGLRLFVDPVQPVQW